MASRGLRQSFFQPAARLCALALFLVWSACFDDSGGNNANEPDAAPAPVCGNGILEEGEECDKGAENSDLEPNACRSDCRLARCGDGVADDGEDCDGQDLAGKSCPDLPDPEAPSGEHFTGGSLACTSDCTYDTSACTRCGDGLAEGQEACDGSDLRGATCATAAGKEDGRLWCNEDCTLNTSECHTCGDGVLEPGEDCEAGRDLAETCESLGYTFGSLACNLETCHYDTTDCHSVCGNGKAETGEQCDGADLGGQDCASVGLVSGELACSPACLLDVSGCSKCGDGILDADRGEECDGTDLGGKTCQDLTGMGGTLACTADCHLDVSGCEAPATCGNGLLDAGEQCDGANLNGQTCESLNPSLWQGGSLRCSAQCTFDTSGCEPVEHCGNGLAESDFGEECDGMDLGGRTCQSEGFAGGNLACNGDCTLDTSGCESAATCGNGTAEGSEQCDGSDLRGKTCQDLSYYAGTLSCTAQCTYDTSGCTTCGDGEVNGPNEQCDGSDLARQSCTSLGYSGGTLRCTEHCQFDATYCTGTPVCGNGILDAGEVCDDGNDMDWDGCTQCSYRDILVAAPPAGSGCLLPRIEMVPDGRFVLAWCCLGNSYQAAFVQRFHADGTPEGGLWLSPDPDESHTANVFAWPDGRLVIGRMRQALPGMNIDVRSWDLAPVWSLDLDLDSQHYDPIFVPLSGHRLAAYVHAYEGASPGQPAGPGSIRVFDAAGSLLASWPLPAAELRVVGDMAGDDSGLYTVYSTSLGTYTLARWTLDGTQLWSLDLATSTNRGRSARLRMGANGQVWLLRRDPNDRVVLSLFDQDGNQLLETVVANQAFGYRIALDAAPDGQAVAVWEDLAHDVYARSFGPDGQPLSPVVKVNDLAGGSGERRPWVGVDPRNGRFIVSYTIPGLTGSVYMRGFAADGSPLGPPPW